MSSKSLVFIPAPLGVGVDLVRVEEGAAVGELDDIGDDAVHDELADATGRDASCWAASAADRYRLPLMSRGMVLFSP